MLLSFVACQCWEYGDDYTSTNIFIGQRCGNLRRRDACAGPICLNHATPRVAPGSHANDERVNRGVATADSAEFVRDRTLDSNGIVPRYEGFTVGVHVLVASDFLCG